MLARDPGRLRDRLLELEPALGRDSAGIRIARAPGRVNLIGEHTDYNHGWVLPVAIDLGVTIAFVPTGDRRVELRLAATGERAIIELDARYEDGAGSRPRWADYVAGMAAALEAAGGRVEGFTGLLAADLPAGVGLSSSAALDVAVGWALGAGTSPLADPMDLARAAQRAENEFVGVPCGLMDPFAVVFGVAGSAVLLDCRSLEHRPVTLLPGTALVVADSGITRDLRTTGYGDRRAECEAAVAVLRRRDRRVVSLRDATLELIEAARDDLGDLRVRRARHVVTENARVLATVNALELGSPARVGELLLASHASLRDDFEVSLPPIDDLVDLAASVPGVFGSRLTGGGFGGATISLVEEAAVERLLTALQDGYRTPKGEPPTVRRVSSSSGAGAIELAR